MTEKSRHLVLGHICCAYQAVMSSWQNDACVFCAKLIWSIVGLYFPLGAVNNLY